MTSSSTRRILEMILLTVVSFSPLLSNYLKVVLIIVLIALNVKSFKTIDKKQVLILFLIFSVFVIGTMCDLRNISSIGELSVLNLYFPLCFFLGFIISRKYKIDEYLYYLEKVVFIVAVFSIIGVFIYSFFPSLVYSLPTYSYYDTNHKTAYIFNILLDEGGIVHRNAGIAWEPGAFQFLMNLGVYAYIRIGNKISFFKIIIYGLAILFTKSTAGIIIFAFITFNILKRNKVARYFIPILILMFVDSIRQEFLYQYNYKLFGSYAFETRLEPMLNAYQMGINHFWGLGNSGYDLLYRDLGLGAYDSFAQIFIRYGYPLLIFISFLLLRLLKNYKTLFLILFVTFLSQTIWFFPLITPFYFMSIKKINSTFQEKGREFDENIMANKYPIT